MPRTKKIRDSDYPNLQEKKKQKKKVIKVKSFKKSELADIIEREAVKIINDYFKKNSNGYDFANYGKLMENPDYVRQMKNDFILTGKLYAPESINRKVIKRSLEIIDGYLCLE